MNCILCVFSSKIVIQNFYRRSPIKVFHFKLLYFIFSFLCDREFLIELSAGDDRCIFYEPGNVLLNFPLRKLAHAIYREFFSAQKIENFIEKIESF